MAVAEAAEEAEVVVVVEAAVEEAVVAAAVVAAAEVVVEAAVGRRGRRRPVLDLNRLRVDRLVLKRVPSAHGDEVRPWRRVGVENGVYLARLSPVAERPRPRACDL